MLIVKTSFGRVPVQKFGIRTMDAYVSDLLDFIRAAASGFSLRELDPAGNLGQVFDRLIRHAAQVELPENIPLEDLGILCEALGKVNDFEKLQESLGKVIRLLPTAIQAEQALNSR